MSGPKDFEFVFAAARLAEMLARRAALQRARLAEAQARREEIRERMQELSKTTAARRASHAEKVRQSAEERFRAIAQQSASRLGAAVPETEATASRKSEDTIAKQLDGVVSAARDGLARLDNSLDSEGDSQRAAFERELESLAMGRRDAQLIDRAETLRDRILQTAARIEERVRQWQDAMVSLRAWDEQLSNDDAVHQFTSATVAKWKDGLTALSTRTPGIEVIDELVTRAEWLCHQAEEIHASAGEQKAKFDERNELLSDILKSWQEIGFFVSDPEYENPNDPGGPVIIKATRGSEQVLASVDLSDTVRTIWNGMADETCKESFFQYVDQMSNKGVEIKPTRPDLQSRPVLKQAGARELPRTKLRGKGS